MAEVGNALSRNPNLCASCSSLTDGMDQSRLSNLENAADTRPEPVRGAAAAGPAAQDDRALEAVPAGQNPP